MDLNLYRSFIRALRAQGVKNPQQVQLRTPVQAVEVMDDVRHHQRIFYAIATDSVAVPAVNHHNGMVFELPQQGAWLHGWNTNSFTGTAAEWSIWSSPEPRGNDIGMGVWDYYSRGTYPGSSTALGGATSVLANPIRPTNREIPDLESWGGLAGVGGTFNFGDAAARQAFLASIFPLYFHGRDDQGRTAFAHVVRTGAGGSFGESIWYWSVDMTDSAGGA